MPKRRRKKIKSKYDYPSQKRSYKKYRKNKCRAFTITFQYENDSDIIDYLEPMECRVDYFRDIIRADIAALRAYDMRAHS